MKYNYYIKHNGVLYAPGTEVPGGDTPSVDVQPKVEETEQPSTEDETDENEETDETEEVSYSRTQIQQMNTAQLKELAEKLGLEFGEEVTVKELKRMIMGKLGI